MMRSNFTDIREAHQMNKERYASSIRWLRANPDHPVCANKERDHFLVAQPPLLTQEGNSDSRFASTTDLGTKREVEDNNLHTPDVSLARHYSTVIVASFLRA